MDFTALVGLDRRVTFVLEEVVADVFNDFFVPLVMLYLLKYKNQIRNMKHLWDLHTIHTTHGSYIRLITI